METFFLLFLNCYKILNFHLSFCLSDEIGLNGKELVNI